ISKAYGWRTAMVMASIPALLLIPALLAIREPEREQSEKQTTLLPEQAKRSIMRRIIALIVTSIVPILRIQTIWWIIASGALLNFNMYAIGTFLPAFFGRVHRLDVAMSGIATGVAYLVGGIAGGILAGYSGDRVVGRKNGRLQVAALLSVLGVPFAYF